VFATIPFFPRIIFHIPLPAGLPMEELEIHGFGVLVALGFLLGGWLSMWRARRHGFDADAINRLIGWLVVGTFVGGHVGYGLMYAPREYLSDPVKFLYVWEGLSSIGGFLVCVPLTVYFFYRYKLPMWANLDNMAVGFSLGWFFGRMGCTVAHDHPGLGVAAADAGSPLHVLAKNCRPVEGATWNLPSWMAERTTDYRWGPCQDGVTSAVRAVSDVAPADFSGVVAAHDMGFYEALMSLGILVLFLILDRRPQVPGIYPLLLGVIYGPSRLLMDFARPASTDGRWFSEVIPGFDGFTAGQAGSALIFAVSIFFLVLRLRSGDTPYWRAQAPAEPGAPAPPPTTPPTTPDPPPAA
jgi:phosphatidylglycerol:prolipoprotein diacylglycerol transferase